MRKHFTMPVDMTQLPRCPTGPHSLLSPSFPHVFYSISFSLQNSIKAVQNVNTSGLSMLGAHRRQTLGAGRQVASRCLRSVLFPHSYSVFLFVTCSFSPSSSVPALVVSEWIETSEKNLRRTQYRNIHFLVPRYVLIILLSKHSTGD